MTIDSGSAVTIIPNTKARDYPSQTTEMQRTGKCYAAANGSRIENEGEESLMCQAQGQNCRNGFRRMKVQVGDVAHGLMSVADLVDSGHRVVFDSEEFGSYAEHKKSGYCMYFMRKYKTYKLDFEVKPFGEVAAFSGQAARS